MVRLPRPVIGDTEGEDRSPPLSRIRTTRGGLISDTLADLSGQRFKPATPSTVNSGVTPEERINIIH